MNREQWHRLNLWVQRFPADFIQKHPDLLMAKAWVYQRQARYSKLFVILDSLERTASTSKKTTADGSVFREEIQKLQLFLQLSGDDEDRLQILRKSNL